LIIGIPIIFIIFGIQSKPLVQPGKEPTIDDVERAKQLIRLNDPRSLRAGEVKTFYITERDLNLFLDYASSHSPGKMQLNAHVDLEQQWSYAYFTFALPDNPFGRYLNISATLSQSGDGFIIRKLRIGKLPVPGWFVNPVGRFAHNYFQHYEEYRQFAEGANSIEKVQFNENSLLLTYRWQPDVVNKLREQGRDLLVPADERERLRVYNERLIAVSWSMNGRTVSLTNFLQPLFQFAKQRTMSTGNAEAENRALIMNVALYSVGRNINRLLGPDERQSTQPGQVGLTLLGRDDLAKHFLVSAAITVSAGSVIANLAGVFKEMDDSRGGSGFSFADLAADRAGVKFAEIAIGSSNQAKQLQQRMSGWFREYDYMPRIDHLPEGIQELEFKRMYKDLDSETYRMVESEIDRRIAACRIYQ